MIDKWDLLIQKSENLKKPTNIQHLIQEEDVFELKTLIRDCLISFLKAGKTHLGLKIYIENELRNDVAEKMLLNIPSKETNLEEWCNIIFANKKFGIVLNSLELYSNLFSEKSASIVQPLIKKAGLPLGGISFLFFMGNYGFTPFGIHKESIGEEGILFHLGPGQKQFYTWDDPKLNKIEHNTTIFRDIDNMLPNSKIHILNSGDAMFIPHQVFHIANSPDFSLSLVMDYINPQIDALTTNLMNSIKVDEKSPSNEYLLPLKDLEQNNWFSMLDKNTINTKIEEALHNHIFSLKSNGGLLKKSLFNNKKGIPNGIFLIKGKPTFPLILTNTNTSKNQVFARGHQINTIPHKGLIRIIESLNKGNSFNITEIRNILEPEWQLTDVYSFISDLLRVEAILVE